MKVVAFYSYSGGNSPTYRVMGVGIEAQIGRGWGSKANATRMSTEDAVAEFLRCEIDYAEAINRHAGSFHIEEAE